MKYAIETTSLTKSFGDVKAVDALELAIEAPGMYGFLGPNGSGKTTTIRLLLGLLSPDDGEARIGGVSVAENPDAVRRHCGALLEHDGLYERLSVEANLDLFGRLWHMDRRSRTARTGEILERFGLYDRRKDNVAEWSRGMKRKLAVGRAMYHKPAILFLDEPSSGLDPVAAAALMDDLKDMVDDNDTTVFLTTHNLAEAEKLCDKVGVLYRGRLVAEGSPTEIRGMSGGKSVDIVASSVPDDIAKEGATMEGVVEIQKTATGLRISLEDDGVVSSVVRHLVGAGVAVEEVKNGSASLEEAFLALVESQKGEEEDA